MKKIISAAALLVPLMASAVTIRSVSMTNYAEPAHFAGLGYVSVVAQNLSVNDEIFVSFVLQGGAGTNEPLSAVSHSQDAQIYTSGSVIVIQSTPNARYTITSILGITLQSGVLDASGTAEIDGHLAQGIYAVSIQQHAAQQFVVK